MDMESPTGTHPAFKKGRERLTGRLAELAAVRKRQPGLIKDIASARMATWDKNDRRTDILHPSEICKPTWCHRASYYDIASGTANRLPYSFKLDNIFTEGHNSHHKWQGWINELGRLWGRWECAHCGNTFTGVSPDVCPDCLWGPPLYREVALEAPGHLIAGHADGYVPDIQTLIEIKTIGAGTVRMENTPLIQRHTLSVNGRTVFDYDGIWSAVAHPFGTHLKQATLYAWMAANDPEIPVRPRTITFIYDYKANQDVKEFTVAPDYKVIEPILTDALAVKSAIEAKKAPERHTQFTKDSAPCQSCRHKTICWDNE